MRRRLAGFVLVLVASAGVQSVRAQGGGDVQDFDTSIRSAGMGRATTGVTWGEPGVWGNPAALAQTRGIAWLEGNTQLIPELVDHIYLKSRRFLIGGGGVGLSLMGDPVNDVGFTRLEAGTAEGTDPFGNPTGTWEIGQTVEAWALAISPAQVYDAVRALRAPGAKALADRVDVAFGYQHKRTRIVKAPGIVAEADNFDWGVNGRYAILPGDPHGRATRIEVTAGYAELNADESSRFDFGPGDTGPSTYIQRTGVGARVVLPLGTGEDGGPSMWSWWPGAVPSAIELGIAYDHEQRSAGGDPPKEDSDHYGFEVSLLSILIGRIGYVSDKERLIEDVTYGVGVHAPIGPWGNVGYDWASYPQAESLSHVNRHGWSAWLYPGAIWESWKGSK